MATCRYLKHVITENTKAHIIMRSSGCKGETAIHFCAVPLHPSAQLLQLCRGERDSLICENHSALKNKHFSSQPMRSRIHHDSFFSSWVLSAQDYSTLLPKRFRCYKICQNPVTCNSCKVTIQHIDATYQKLNMRSYLDL